MFRHYRKAVGALLVYDVTKYSSFANVGHWAKELRASAEPNLVIMLVGNKLDVCEEDRAARQVPREEAEAYAKKSNMLFEEVSAVKDVNVRDAFENLLQSTVCARYHPGRDLR